MSKNFERLPAKVSEFLINGKDLDESKWADGLLTALKEFKKRQLEYIPVLEKIKPTRKEWSLDVESVVLSTWEELHSAQEKRPSRPPVWDFVTAWMKEHSVKYEAGSCQYYVDGVKRSPNSLVNRMFIDSDRAKYNFRKDDLATPLRIMEEDFKNQALAELRTKLKYTGPNDELRKWVKNITGRENILDYQIMKHFIWSVKMKLYHGPDKVEHHMMPILVGGQGIGKTKAIRHLVKPLGHFVDFDADFDMLQTEVKRFRLANSLVGVFDELTKSSTADLADVKRIMSADTIGWRELYSQFQMVGPNMMTGIGCSNFDVVFQIADSSGNRRFPQIDCREKRKNKYPTNHPEYLKEERAIFGEEQKIWEEMNNIDPLLIFQGVDEADLKPPIKDVKAELTASMEQNRRLDPVEEFLRDATEPVDIDSPEATLLSDIYTQYAKFQEMQGTKARFSRDMLGKKLKAMIGEPKHCRRGNVYPVKVVDFYNK